MLLALLLCADKKAQAAVDYHCTYAVTVRAGRHTIG